MSISQTEAASALSEIERTTQRSNTLRGYRIAGPFLMVWGVVWMLGYLGTGLLSPNQSGEAWLGLDALGAIVTTILILRRKDTARASANGWRSGVAALAIFVFVGATLTLFRATSPAAVMAFPGLVCGLVYILGGLWRMTRLAWLGAAMFVATAAGYYLFSPWLAFWMAGTGAGLLVGGLWLRRA